MQLDKLFEPIRIGNCTVKNRIAMAPMNLGYTGPNGYVSDHTLAWAVGILPDRLWLALIPSISKKMP